MVEPLDLDHHVAVVSLPEKLHPADVGPVDPGRGQKDGTVANVQNLVLSLYGAMEQFLGLPLATRSSVAFISL